MLNQRCRAALLACAFLALSVAPLPSHASGFAIFEQGAKGMGFAGAFTAQSDPSSIFHNAAGIGFLKGKQLYFGGTLIAPSTEFAGASPFPGAGVIEKGDAGLIIPPALDYTQQLSENLVVGIGVHVPFGLRTRWENRETTFSGRFLSKRAQVQSISINPTVAYKLADRLAIGGGLDIRLTKVELDRNVPAINPFTLRAVDAAAVALTSKRAKDFGFNLGFLAKPTESLSIGASYRHSVQVDFEGEANFTLLPTGNGQLDAAIARRLPAGSVAVTTDIQFPSLFSVGAAYEWSDWTLAGQVDFQQWSSFDSLPLTFEGRGDLSSVIEEGYQNSRIYRVGLERRFGERWALRGGYYLDKTPVPVASVSPLLPDADRQGLAAGFSFQSGNWRLDVANWYLFFKDRSTEGQSRENFNGTYKANAELLAVSLGWSF